MFVMCESVYIASGNCGEPTTDICNSGDMGSVDFDNGFGEVYNWKDLEACSFVAAEAKDDGDRSGKGKKGKGKKSKGTKSAKAPKSAKEPKSAKAPKKGKAAGLEAKQSQAARLEVGAGVALVGMVGLVALVATKMARPSSTETDYILPPVEV